MSKANICFNCKNSVPDDKGHGCPWSRKFEPVPGWTAKKVILNPGRKYTQTETYQITHCPEFDPDDRKNDTEKMAVAVRCIETGIVYESITKASKAVGRDFGTIAKAIRDGMGYAHGYHWEKVQK